MYRSFCEILKTLASRPRSTVPRSAGTYAQDVTVHVGLGWMLALLCQEFSGCFPFHHLVYMKVFPTWKMVKFLLWGICHLCSFLMNRQLTLAEWSTVLVVVLCTGEVGIQRSMAAKMLQPMFLILSIQIGFVFSFCMQPYHCSLFPQVSKFMGLKDCVAQSICEVLNPVDFRGATRVGPRLSPLSYSMNENHQKFGLGTFNLGPRF